MSRSRQQRRAELALRARPQSARRARSNAAAPSPRPWLLIGVGVLVVVLAAVGAVVLAGSGAATVASSPTAGPSVAIPTLSGKPLPAFADASGDPAVGQPIPEAAGTSFDGTSVAIAADGRPKVLLFLAHWCPHCQAEVPVVQAWLNAGRLPANVDLISIATAIDPSRPNYPPDAWLARERWTAPVLVDPNDSVATRYGLGAFPYWVVVRADGTVAQRLTGRLTEAQLDELVSSVRP